MKNTALITGASSGIGKEFARLHAKNGDDVILVARRKQVLEELKSELETNFGITVKVMAKDLSDLTTPQEIYNELKAEKVEVEYLINNAGFGGHGNFHERPLEKDLAMINVNVTSLMLLTKLILPDMVKRNSGRIMNVSSTASFVPGPLQAVYYATKAFVTSFSEAISEELSETNITVTALCPGPIDTEFAQTGNLGNTELFKKNKAATPKSVAEFGYTSMMKGKRVVINDKRMRLLPKVVSLFPRKMLLRISKKTMQNVN